VLNALVDGLLASTCGLGDKPSALILDPKGDFHSKIRLVCERYGRKDDLVVLDAQQPRQSIRWNPFDSDDDELEVSSRFAAVLESVGVKSSQDTFWVDSAKKFIRHSIALIRATNPQDEPPSFAAIGELAASWTPIDERIQRFPDDHPSWQSLVYFTTEWAELADQTRSSIQAYITNMVDPFLMDPYVWLFAGASTMRIAEMIDQGKILYVHMPIADKEAMSRVVNTFIKLEFYREVLKRPNKKRASFFLCDEFQAFFTTAQGKGDADFFERSRQSRHANVIATQNLPALMKQLGDNKAPAMNLLGNCAVKVFLRNTDDETNQYASNLFGQSLVLMQGSGGGGGGGRIPGVRSMASSQSANMQYDSKVRKEAFTELAVPFAKGGIDYCETIVHLASRGEVTKEKLRWKVHPLVA
jgi:type IV secretory pathway TraG/TraD family ATPase VirD4